MDRKYGKKGALAATHMGGMEYVWEWEHIHNCFSAWLSVISISMHSITRSTSWLAFIQLQLPLLCFFASGDPEVGPRSPQTPCLWLKLAKRMNAGLWKDELPCSLSLSLWSLFLSGGEGGCLMRREDEERRKRGGWGEEISRLHGTTTEHNRGKRTLKDVGHDWVTVCMEGWNTVLRVCACMLGNEFSLWVLFFPYFPRTH